MTPMERYRRDCSAFFARLGTEGPQPLVFGDGRWDRPVLMLIGEAPGEQEALMGRPFVGKAGKNLETFLQALRMRREDLYVTNVVKIRPTKLSAAGRIVNRPPSLEERALFTPWLMREVALVRPKALVTLGNVALRAFVADSVGRRHGAWSRAVVQAPDAAAFTLPLFSLYHPASVIYNPALKTVYAADLRALAASLGEGSDEPGDI